VRGRTGAGGRDDLSDYDDARPAFAGRFGSALDRAEHIYLRLLRAVILIIATGLIIFAAWLGISSTYKILRSPDSVQEQVAAVSPDELTSAEMPTREEAAAAQGKPAINVAQKRYYANLVARYYNLFRTKFEPFRQSEDKQLTRGEFDDSFINSTGRLQAVAKGDLNFEEDKADLETLLRVMTEAAAKPETQQRLRKYRAATKVRVATRVERTRTAYRRGWDSYSTACVDWYESPYGCPVQRAEQVPYTETVYSMEFPKGTQPHTQIFRAFQDRFFTLLEERRDASAQKAESERSDILAGNIAGKMSLFTALQVLGGFLILMFFFLLIAIERHQRKISARS
jgi:hypothetical protein